MAEEKSTAQSAAPTRITLEDIEAGAGYPIRPGQTQYEAYPGGWLTLAGRNGRITIAMGRAVEAITEAVVAERLRERGAEVPPEGPSQYDVGIERARACTTAPEGFDWNHEDLDGAILARAVEDFFLRSAGILSRPARSSIS